ncbi:hypothetical protein [Streptomyces sp. NBC_00338]|uniref:hypothetical protein n=1 Tax=Streptomyces sp. NBC_00338 TaxID=2975715 RepID=UPI00224D7703|nr:hypothetical protein [Streptomyces sp. NBC_00338]MCX5138350.1 hypothetical protein [Streptomyces sp. NBC_00338]MCX5145139.1 hypothetical protein [Streptomyces sp. NBC_00338]
MPIHLKVPAHRNGGPDGQGWNRMSLGSLAGDQCALRPRDYSHLRESQDTRRARYGGYGPCVSEGNCAECPILQASPRHLDSLDSRVLVRIHADGYLYLMNRPDDGWASSAKRWTWQDVARLDGWEIGRRHCDAHSDGFWLERTTP